MGKVSSDSPCECGCGNELGDSPSLYFKWDVCQALWLMSQGEPDPVWWREKYREIWILMSFAPMWHPTVLANDIANWEMSVRSQYNWSVWSALCPGEKVIPNDWLPTLAQALPYMVNDWWDAHSTKQMQQNWGEHLYQLRYFIPSTA